MKDPLRLAMRARRDAIGRAQRERLSAQIAENLWEWPAIPSAKTILAYSSIGSEVETRGLIESFQREGKRVALPRMEGKGLVLHEAMSLDALISNHVGIAEPPPSWPVVAPSSVDVVLVPGLAFDLRGARLGYGGGYYDRLLSTAPKCLRVGLAFGAQLVPSLPSTHLDAPLDLVVTEQGVHALPKRDH